MALEFKLPDIGEGVVEGEIVRWMVQEGDPIREDQPMVEVMTDKATVEIPSPRSGRVARILAPAGKLCAVGQVMLVIEEEGEGATSSAVPAASVEAPAAPPVSAPSAAITTPQDPGPGGKVLATPATRQLARQLGVDIRCIQGTGPGGRVIKDDVQRAKGGDRPTAPLPVVSRTPVSADHRTARLAGTGTPPPAPPPPPDEPLVLPKGAAALQGLPRTGAPAPQAAPAGAPAKVEPQTDERVPFRGVRRKIADNLTRSKQTAAHFTYVEECDVTELSALRQRARKRAEERGIKLSFLPFIIKAVVAGLKKHPIVNSTLDTAREEIVLRKQYHIGVAAATEAGLIVPVLRDADQLSLFQIAGQMEALSERVRTGKATREEITGSTFTISSLGALGGVLATPIINFPEVAVLGVHKMRETPVVREGQIVIRTMMNLSISLDHRIVDGYEGAQFLAHVIGLLEDPTLMFMEMV